MRVIRKMYAYYSSFSVPYINIIKKCTFRREKLAAVTTRLARSHSPITVMGHSNGGIAIVCSRSGILPMEGMFLKVLPHKCMLQSFYKRLYVKRWTQLYCCTMHVTRC